MSPRPAGIEAVLLDIEGTTTPIAFVTEVLFPYARTHLRAHLERHAADPVHTSLVARLRDEHHSARARGEALPEWRDDTSDARMASAVALAEWLMDHDSKSPPLKELQGLIWEDGYRQGMLAGQVFPDVPPALRRWHGQHLSISIYSSGSVLAQQLLFRHSSAGDLTSWLDAYFDANIGPKIDGDSYRRIARRLGLAPDALLFLSDAPRELEAAGDAGLHVRLVSRPGNAPPPEGHTFPVVHSFDAI